MNWTHANLLVIVSFVLSSNARGEDFGPFVVRDDQHAFVIVKHSIVGIKASETLSREFGEQGRFRFTQWPGHRVRLRDIGMDADGRLYVVGNVIASQKVKLPTVQIALNPAQPGLQVQAIASRGAQNQHFIARLLPDGTLDETYADYGIRILDTTEDLKDKAVALAVSPRGETAILIISFDVLKKRRVEIFRMTQSGDFETSFGQLGVLEVPGFEKLPELWGMESNELPQVHSFDFDRELRLQLGVVFSASLFDTYYLGAVAISKTGKTIKRLNEHAPYIGGYLDAQKISVLTYPLGRQLLLASNGPEGKAILEGFRLPSGFHDRSFALLFSADLSLGVDDTYQKTLRASNDGTLVLFGIPPKSFDSIRYVGIDPENGKRLFCHTLSKMLVQ